MYHKFEENDIFINTLELYPRVRFKFIGGKIISEEATRSEPAISRSARAYTSANCGANPSLDLSCAESSYYVGVI